MLQHKAFAKEIPISSVPANVIACWEEELVKGEGKLCAAVVFQSLTSLVARDSSIRNLLEAWEANLVSLKAPNADDGGADILVAAIPMLTLVFFLMKAMQQYFKKNREWTAATDFHIYSNIFWIFGTISCKNTSSLVMFPHFNPCVVSHPFLTIFIYFIYILSIFILFYFSFRHCYSIHADMGQRIAVVSYHPSSLPILGNVSVRSISPSLWSCEHT